MKATNLFTSAMLSLLGTVASAQTLPEPPSLWREVTGVVYTDPTTTVVAKKLPVHTHAHVPSFRTSRDGRIGLRVLPSGDFTLLMPEKPTNFVSLTQSATLDDNSYVMSKKGYVYVDGVTSTNSPAKYYTVPTGTIGSVGHFTLFDPTPANPTVGEDTNPKSINGEDVYDLKVFAGFDYASNDPVNPSKEQFFITPVRVTVANPKTINAYIRVITRTGNPVGGPILAMQGALREPSIVGDGRLIVFRGCGSVPWIDPVTGAHHPTVDGSTAQSFDIAYSYYTPQQGAPCDPTQWQTLIPISHAPFDTRINTQFGFAKNPFRDPAGTAIPDGADIGGTYPWVDRDAKNLFFTVISDTLRYKTGSTYTASRYVQVPTPGELVDNAAEESSGTRGICFAGLWSHGKTVLIDNLNNDMDYAMNTGDNLYTRMVRLFDTTGVVPALPEWLKLGGGRVNSSPNMPPGDNRNSTIIESLENIFNYRKFAAPITVRDVVWPLHNAKQSDDLVFDDYVDHDAFIVANMSGLATFQIGGGNSKNSFFYNSGWSDATASFSLPVKLQNAATSTNTTDTSPVHRWVVPTQGLVVNSGSSKGRLEPAATGGIHGKGFWMDGNIGLQFAVLAQPQSVSSHDWYASLFVDCRFDDDSTSRALLSFPDNSSICLTGRHQLEYFNAAGVSVKVVNLPAVNASAFPDLLPKKGWAHLAWQIRNGGTVVEFLLNGLVYDLFSASAAMFQMAPAGAMSVGKDSRFPNEPGFKGWIDDLIVLAHSVDPETACNHAGGTLVGLRASYTTGPLLDFAARFPASTHTEISNRLLNNGETPWPKYANLYNYTQDDGVQLANIPANTVSLRSGIHFPEGPLFFNRPRPDSTKNSFCITCHSSQGKGGLDLMALELIPGLNANLDDRRQPSQSFRRLFGNIPVGLVDNTSRSSSQPTVATVLPASGKLIDEWVQSSFGNVVTVKTFTLVDAVNSVDLATLKNGDVVNRATYGATSYAIRANVDYAQGDVTLSFDGGALVTRDRIPYSITPASFAPGSHTITATPQLGGVPVTITFTVQ